MPELQGVLARVVGRPVSVEVLKDKPGRRRTVRACGPLGTVVAKAYASARAPVVAARVSALSGGPPEPDVPRVLLVDPGARVVVLTEVPGRPLVAAVVSGDLGTCRRAGAALGRWHAAWWARTPAALQPHPVERELAILGQRAATASGAARQAVRGLPPELHRPWPCPTAVHRDLYEEQVVVAGRVGLIDLDDVAAGPPELDVGNLLAHLALLARRHGHSTAPAAAAILTGYRAAGPALDQARLVQCEQLSRIRLACIHAEPALLAAGAGLVAATAPRRTVAFGRR